MKGKGKGKNPHRGKGHTLPRVPSSVAASDPIQRLACMIQVMRTQGENFRNTNDRRGARVEGQAPSLRDEFWGLSDTGMRRQPVNHCFTTLLRGMCTSAVLQKRCAMLFNKMLEDTLHAESA